VRWSLIPLTLLLIACAAPGEPEPAPGPPPAAVAPAYNPPPAATEALDPAQLLELAESLPPDEVISKVDRHPLAFELDEAALAELRAEGLPTEVLDYLRKRSRIDWGALRGEVDPERDPPE